MYESFFGLTKRPFCTAPRPDHYFPAEAVETARKTLARCIERVEGLGVVIGPTGTGKTMLCRVLAAQFQEALRVALLASGHLRTRRALLQAVLFELGRPYRKMDEGELRLALSHYLLRDEDGQQPMLLLVDEAHTLPLRLLEEIRVIANVTADGQPRVRTVLAGGSALEERLASPKLEAFSQRLAARCYLEPFDRCQTQQFIRAQIGAAGGKPERLFPDDACRAVFQATDGIPRLINQVCDHALVLAFAGGQTALSAEGIQEAWADLQQLPTPWGEGNDRCEEAEGNIIEFGRLDEEPAPARAPAPQLRLSPQTTEPADFVQPHSGGDENELEFRPAGTIGPEVELSFPDPGNPFSEEFEQEEVVAGGPGKPTPSPAGEATGAGQPEAPQQAAAMDISQDEDGTEMLAAINELRREGPGVVEFGSLDDAGSQTDVPHDSAPNEQPAEGHVAASAEPLESVESGFADSREPLEPGAVEDEDLIVVEDQYRDEYPSIRPIASARRQEYRQLFARLRRG